LAVRRRAMGLLKDKGVRLPTFAELAEPGSAPCDTRARLAGVDPDALHPANLYRVNWFNDAKRTGRSATPVFVELPESFTGVKARIAVVLGALFPMIRAHKVLAAYACLAPRLVAGRFDPARQRAVWPSTGNYCRGGVAISRILGCRGVAVLPEGMSRERFDWLSQWVAAPEDIVRTPGTESNVKEIYDKCAELARDPANEIVNQFNEFGNYLVHWRCTGPALEKVFEAMRPKSRDLKLAGFVSASGSAGTLAAGDYLKDRHGTRIAVVEAAECPTLLMNGYGEHNIQGIGDKHVPLIHNVMNTDLVIGVSDRATDGLNAVFNTEQGRAYMARRLGLRPPLARMLGYFGLSSIANILGAIKMARHLRLGPQDVIATVAADGHEMYASELARYLKRCHTRGDMTETLAAELVGEHLLGTGTEHVLDATERERARMFNLGYFTWAEQQGIAIADFERRRSQDFWRGLHALIPQWDAMIEAFNRDSGMAAAAA
jgi:cysteine synthase